MSPITRRTVVDLLVSAPVVPPTGSDLSHDSGRPKPSADPQFDQNQSS
ncbi:hypothetical protein [Streptomyces sp. LUP30]|nr:hypothetical protein [Streptomyces sp. LUP30]